MTACRNCRLVLLLILAVMLGACGGSSGGGASTYTIMVNVGPNGATSFTGTITLNEGDVHSFTITPDAGYNIDVSGCGGALVGNTYTTGGSGGGALGGAPADCTVTVNFTAPVVAALFPFNGGNWNDYVNGSDFTTAGDTACNTFFETACLHGGEFRVLEVPGLSSCFNLTATDLLGAFNWACENNSGNIRFISTGLAEGMAMSDLIDFASPGFLANSVTVRLNGVPVVTTDSTAWWTNAFAVDNDGGMLNTASTIVLVTADPSSSYFIDATGIGLVVQPGVTITGTGTSGNVITLLSNGDHAWIEGSLDASGENNGIRLNTAGFSRVHSVSVINAADSGINVDNSNFNTLRDLKLSNNDNGLSVGGGARYNTITGVVASYNTFNGVKIGGSPANILSRITASNNGSSGINLLGQVVDSVLSGLTVNNNDEPEGGILVNNSSKGNVLSDISSIQNEHGIRIQVGASGNTVIRAALGNNAQAGIYATTGGHTFADITVAHNPWSGIYIDTNSSNNRFTGVLQVGNNGADCNVGGGGTNPGLVHGTCAQQGASDFGTPVTGIDLTASFVGKVLSDDAQNDSDLNGFFPNFPPDPDVFDWTHFDNRFRGWGLNGSAFPNADHQGQWTTGVGRIWDWSVSLGDNGNAGGPALLGALLLPAGNDTLTHVWDTLPVSNTNSGCRDMVPGSSWNGAACESTFLRRAVELMHDGRGNDNLLCESGERCLYTPNIGSYQGHGDLVTATIFLNGTLTGITLLEHENNGR